MLQLCKVYWLLGCAIQSLSRRGCALAHTGACIENPSLLSLEPKQTEPYYY